MSRWVSERRGPGCRGSWHAAGGLRRRAPTASRPRSGPPTLTTRPAWCGTAADASLATGCWCPGRAWFYGRPPGTTGGSTCGTRPAPRREARRPGSRLDCCTAMTGPRYGWAAIRSASRTPTHRPVLSRTRQPALLLRRCTCAEISWWTRRRSGPGCTPPHAGCTSPGSTAPGSATPNWHRAGRSITAAFSTRPTTSRPWCVKVTTSSPQSSQTAGGAGMSASTRANPRTTTATRRRSWRSWWSTSPTAPARWWPPTNAGPNSRARSGSPIC